MDTAQEITQKALEPSLAFEIGKVQFNASYVQAFAIVFLIFILIMTLARLRKMYVSWSLKGSLGMMIMGFVLAIIVEGFLILGGRTFLTEILGWKSAPKPVQTALDTGRSKLVDVLGVTEEIPSSRANEGATLQSVVTDFESLSANESVKVKQLICDQ